MGEGVGVGVGTDVAVHRLLYGEVVRVIAVGAAAAGLSGQAQGVVLILLSHGHTQAGSGVVGEPPSRGWAARGGGPAAGSGTDGFAAG